MGTRSSPRGPHPVAARQRRQAAGGLRTVRIRLHHLTVHGHSEGQTQDLWGHKGLGRTGPGDHEHRGVLPTDPTPSFLPGCLYPTSPGMPPPTLAIQVPPQPRPRASAQGAPWGLLGLGPRTSPHGHCVLLVASGPICPLPPCPSSHRDHLHSVCDLAVTPICLCTPGTGAALTSALLTPWPQAPPGRRHSGGLPLGLGSQDRGTRALCWQSRDEHPPQLPGLGRRNKAGLPVEDHLPTERPEHPSHPTSAQPQGLRAPPPGAGELGC